MFNLINKTNNYWNKNNILNFSNQENKTIQKTQTYKWISYNEMKWRTINERLFLFVKQQLVKITLFWRDTKILLINQLLIIIKSGILKATLPIYLFSLKPKSAVETADSDTFKYWKSIDSASLCAAPRSPNPGWQKLITEAQ